mgnify:CR=1 FL=1
MVLIIILGVLYVLSLGCYRIAYLKRMEELEK